MGLVSFFFFLIFFFKVHLLYLWLCWVFIAVCGVSLVTEPGLLFLTRHRLLAVTSLVEGYRF